MTIEERIERLEERIEKLERRCKGIIDDLNNLYDVNPQLLYKSIREIQEHIAKEQNIPVSSFVWRV